MNDAPFALTKPIRQEAADFLIDSWGFFVIRSAIERALVARLNAIVDAWPVFAAGESLHGLKRLEFPESAGTFIGNVIEAGAPFHELIDHPAFFPLARRYIGEDDGVRYGSSVRLSESFVVQRNQGQALRLHSGGHRVRMRTQYRCSDGQWCCGEVNVLIALSRIGPGDGATVVVPGSHKSTIPHPALRQPDRDDADSPEGVVGGIEVYLETGDALVFVDAVAHGGTARHNAGNRTIVVYRYSPACIEPRCSIPPSPQLLAALSPSRRAIVAPKADYTYLGKHSSTFERPT